MSPKITKDRIFYWAYGSNLSEEQMHHRCPRARKYGPLTVPNARLVFRGTADIAMAEGFAVPGGLWLITPQCERELDINEGVRVGRYSKRQMKIKVGDDYHMALFYQMVDRRGIQAPTPEYLKKIERGYDDFGLNEDVLYDAVNHAVSNRRMTPEMVQWWNRKGRPQLARPIFKVINGGRA